MSPYTISPDLNGEGLHIGIVRARFNETVGLTELDACLLELQALSERELVDLGLKASELRTVALEAAYGKGC
jgi:6,7-dimethyl-8-ribityllumazine synthase